MHGFSALDRPGGTVRVIPNLVGAGPAIYEQAVVKSERVDSGGLNSNHLFGVSRRGDAPYLLMRG